MHGVHVHVCNLVLLHVFQLSIHVMCEGRLLPGTADGVWWLRMLLFVQSTSTAWCWWSFKVEPVYPPAISSKCHHTLSFGGNNHIHMFLSTLDITVWACVSVPSLCYRSCLCRSRVQGIIKGVCGCLCLSSCPSTVDRHIAGIAT